MQRHRQVAAAPQRGHLITWDAIAELVVATLDRSPHIVASDVTAAMEAAKQRRKSARCRWAPGKYALVVVADPVYLNITTVYG